MAASRIKGITIEINGDSTKLTSALSSVNKAISNTQSNLRDLDKALQLDPGNTSLLRDKQEELGKEIDNVKSKIDTEKQALDQMKNTDGFDANSKAARDLQTQIDLDEASLKQLEKQAKDFGSVGKQQFKAVCDQVQEVGNKIKDVGDSISGFGKDMTTKVTTPIVAAFGSAVKVTADFDSQMSKVQAISGATGNEFDQLRDKARELGSQTKYSATEVAEGFEYMGMAGWDTQSMLEGIPAILNLAAASGEELGTTSDIVTDALTAFGYSAEDAARFADILASAATNSNTNVAMMGESFKYVAPVAGSLGYSAEDVAIALGLMANSGIKADMAGTSLRNMFQRMAKPTKESDVAMQRLGLTLADDEGKMYSFREIMDQMRDSFSEINMSAEDYDKALDELDQQLADGTLSQSKYEDALEELNKQAFGAEGAEKARAAAMLGGTRAMSGLLAIANATEEDYNNLTTAIDGSSDAFAKLADGSVVPLNEALESGQEIMEAYNGQAEAMAATMQDNLGGDITTLKSMLEELSISFGDLLMPTIRDIVGHIQNVVDWLNQLDEPTKEMIIKIAAVAAAIGPLLVVLGTVISTVGTIVAVLASPVGIILAIIAAVTALGVAIALNWDSIKEWAHNVADTVSTKWNEVKTNVSEAFDNMKENVSKRWDEIKEKIQNSKVAEVVKETWQAAKDTMQEKLDNMKQAYDAHGGGLEGAVYGAMEGIKGYYTAGFTFVDKLTDGKLGNMLSTVKTKMLSIKDDIGAKFSTIKDDTKKKIGDMKTNIDNTFSNIKNGISQKVTGIKDSIVNGFKNAVDYIKDLPRQAWNWGSDLIGGIIDGIKAKIGGIADAVSGIADTISSYIHFSEPDVGPLKNFHTFMPDMIKEMISGINHGLPSLENAMSNMSSKLVPTQMLNNTPNGGNNISNSVTIPITVNAGSMDANELANKLTSVISNKINAQIYSKGAAWA